MKLYSKPISISSLNYTSPKSTTSKATKYLAQHNPHYSHLRKEISFHATLSHRVQVKFLILYTRLLLQLQLKLHFQKRKLQKYDDTIHPLLTSFLLGEFDNYLWISSKLQLHAHIRKYPQQVTMVFLKYLQYLEAE